MLALTLVASLVAGGSAEDVESILEELIERTNELDGFRAVYRRTSSEDEDGLIELCYSAPSELQVSMRRDDGEDLAFGMWLSGDEVCVLSEVADGEPLYARFELHVSEAYDVLERSFPPALDGSLGPGPYVSFFLMEEPDESGRRFSLEAGWSATARRTIAGWLPILLAQAEQVELGEAELVLEEDGCRLVLSRETGFLTEALRVDEEGAEHGMRLELLELAPESDPECASWPSRPDGARDASEDMRAAWEARLDAPTRTRSYCLGRIVQLLDSDDLDWNRETRAGCEDVLRAIYEPWLSEGFAEHLASCRERSEELARWLEERLDEGAAPESLRERVREHREALERSLESSLQAWLEAREDAPPPEDAAEQWADLIALDEEIFGAVYEELVTSVALDDFDAAVEEVLREEQRASGCCHDRARRPGGVPVLDTRCST